MNKKDFYNISMNGRYAYQLMCAERYLLKKYPNKDFTKIFEILWQGTNGMYWDDLAGYIIDLIPSNLYDGNTYEEVQCLNLSKTEFEYFYNLLKDVGEDFEELFLLLKDHAYIYEGTNVPKYGKESINIIFDTIALLQKNNIELPDINLVKFSTMDQFYGWGDNFDGTKLSIILNKK